MLEKSHPYSTRWAYSHSEGNTEINERESDISQLLRRRKGLRGVEQNHSDECADDMPQSRKKSGSIPRSDAETLRTDKRWLVTSPNQKSSPRLQSSRQADRDEGNEFHEDVKRPNTLKPNWAEVNRDSLLVLNADHQRRAFGIPPSHSDIGTLSSVESQNSVQYSAYEENPGPEVNNGLNFSNGAEQLFQSLGIGKSAVRPESFSARPKRQSWRSSMIEAERYLRDPPSKCPPPPLSASSSESSIYEDVVPTRPWQKREHDLDRIHPISAGSAKSSWRKTLSTSAYVSLLEKYGQTEMNRQEVIWRLCESEQVFLKSLRTVLKVFVQPLLGKNRAWVAGLPSSVSRLLDWLEDIFQLHTQISSALQHARSSQYPVVLKFSETLRSFVPRLEVYQPYIVRLDEVIEIIEGMVEDEGSELGEFFKLQSGETECGGMEFSAFLWLPLTRLGRYLKYFNVSLPSLP